MGQCLQYDEVSSHLFTVLFHSHIVYHDSSLNYQVCSEVQEIPDGVS